MANASWLVPAAVAVITPLIMAALGRPSARPVAADTDGLRTLRLPRFIGILGWMALVISLVFIYGACATALKGEWMSVLFLLFGAGFGAMALSLIRQGRYHVVRFDAERMIVTDGRRRTDACLWTDLVSGRVHPLSKMIVLRTKDGTRLRVHPHLIGGDELFRTMAEKTGLPVQEWVRKARHYG